MRLDYTVRQFNHLLDTFKKVRRLGESCIIYNDIIKITERNPKLVGKHFLENNIIELDKPYKFSELSTIVSQLDSIKGKKTELYLLVTDFGISITINDITVQLAHISSLDELDELESYHDKTELHSWSIIPTTTVEEIRCNNCITISDSTHRVRIAKSLFPEFGTSRVIKFKMQYRFESQDNEEFSRLFIETIFDNIKILHRYTCVNYHNE